MATQSTSDPMLVLLTRPRAQSQEFADSVTARFGAQLLPVIAPLMEIVELHPARPERRFAGVIFTSANGVRAASGMADLPGTAWCVGDKTADAARTAGFVARSGQGDAGALVEAILADPPDGPLLHLRGAETRGEVAERLNSAGIETLSLVVYRQTTRPMPDLGRATLQADGPVIVPLFSPESARRFAAEIMKPPVASLRLVALSKVVADAAEKVPRVGLWVARRPDADAMLDAIGLALDGSTVP